MSSARAVSGSSAWYDATDLKLAAVLRDKTDCLVLAA
jgi:hypothetical protein